MAEDLQLVIFAAVTAVFVLVACLATRRRHNAGPARQNFVFAGGTTGSGILIAPTTGTLAFTITNTTASNNSFAGILFLPPSGSPSANGVIDHVVADANQYGIDINVISATGGANVVTVSDSIASNNSQSGIFAGNGAAATIKLSIDNVTASGNQFGITANNPANLLLGRSVITGNTTGVLNSTSPNTVYTYKDNRINLNGTDIGGPTPSLNTSFATQ